MTQTQDLSDREVYFRDLMGELERFPLTTRVDVLKFVHDLELDADPELAILMAKEIEQQCTHIKACVTASVN